MKIGQNLEAFRAFATEMKDVGKESAVIRATEANVFGGRRLQVAVATDDKAYALFRSDDAKSANTRTRDLFFRTIAKEFGGEKFIPQSVRDVMTNFGGVSNKPLTARRIVAICDAVVKEKQLMSAKPIEIQMPPPEIKIVAPPPDEPKVEKKGVDLPMSKFAEVVRESKKPSLLKSISSGFMSFFWAPKPKVFKLENGKLGYEEMPDKPNPDVCRQIRKGLVDALYNDMLTRGKLEKDVAEHVIASIKKMLLDESVANTPLKLDDPAVKDALDITEGFGYGVEYDDSVSKNVLNRGTLKLNPATLFEKIVAPALSKVLDDKNIALFSKAKATVDDEGYLSVTFDHAQLKKEWEMLSKIDDVLPSVLKPFAGSLKESVAGDLGNVTLKIKPEYDAKTGIINLSVKVPTSSVGKGLVSTVAGLRSQIAEAAQDKVGTSSKQAVSVVPLSEAEKADASMMMKVAVNLRHFGTKQLSGFGLNTSVAGNITDVKFTKNGMVVQIGDNPLNDKVENAGQVPVEDAADGNDVSLNVVPSAVAPSVETLLRNKVGFTSMSMSTAAGQNGKSGTMKLSLKGLDIPALTASKTGAGFAILRKLGVLQVSDIDIEIRPSLDPISKRIRLDVTGLSGTGAVGGVRGSLARKLLSTILPKVLGDLGGVGFVPGDDILSVTVDAQRFLAKVIPDPEKVIPGGIPSISEFSANENGFKIGVKC